MAERISSPDLVRMLSALPREQVPAALLVLAARLAEPEPGRNGHERVVEAEIEPRRSGDRWLTVAQVAERLGRDRRWVYRRAHSWDFTSKDGKALLFSERGLTAWMDGHRVGGSSR